MVTLITLSLIVLLVVPFLIASLEDKVALFHPEDDGAWTLARALAGGVHLRWSPDPRPIVWFESPAGKGRLHGFRRAGEREPWVELRIYLDVASHLAAKISTTDDHGLISFKGLKPYRAGEKEAHLARFYLQTNDSARFAQLLSLPSLRASLQDLKERIPTKNLELLFLNTLIIVKARWEGEQSELSQDGDALEQLGLPMRALGEQLAESVGEFVRLQRNGFLEEDECPVSGYPLQGRDLWRCEFCQSRLHRVCFESLGGCANPDCEGCTDGIHTTLTEERSASLYQALLDQIGDEEEPEDPQDADFNVEEDD